MPGVLLLGLYVALLIAPVALAWAQGRSPRSFSDDLSSGLAMTAFAALLVQFALSGRFRAISRRIGMDTTMRFHQLVARTVLLLVLLHPFLYTMSLSTYFPPWSLTAVGYLWLDGATLLSGAVAWVLLLALVVAAIARDSLPCRYEGWRLTHGLGAALVAGLSMHHAMGAGRYAAEPALGWFWLGLFLVALATLAHVYLISPLIQLRRPFEVVSVGRIAERTWELVVRRRDGRPFAFEPGQFVWLSLARTPFTLHENPFSISSAPSEGERLAFVIKEVGDFTRSLGRVAPGRRAWLDGPYGNLVLPGPEEAPGVGLVAGGVGIAPLLAILREMRARGDRRPASLIYGNRSEEQIVYRDELDRLAAELDLSVTHVLGEPPEGWTGRTGWIDADNIAAALDGREGTEHWTYLMCGPPPMLDSAEAALMARGVPAGRIRAERFVYD